MNTTQRAVLIRAYGGADAVEVGEIAHPKPGQGKCSSAFAPPA